MKILIIDDHPLYRDGLQSLLSDLYDGLACKSVAGLSELDDESIICADLILLDLDTADTKGLNTLSKVRSRNPQGSIVIISSYDEPELVQQCIEQGAVGFIPKTSDPTELVNALRIILQGGIYLPSDCALEQVDDFKETCKTPLKGLTKRQLHALLLVAKGQANKNIADKMGITEGTVKLHLSAAFKTLNVSNRTEAVYALSKMGFKEADMALFE